MVSSFDKNSEKWGALFGKDTFKVEKDGFDLYIPNTNTDSYGCFLVDSIHGHDSVAYDSKSTHTYFILDGSGTFEVDGKKIDVGNGDVVKINPNQVFYYSGTMKMVEEIVPNFKEENFHVVEKVSYPSAKSSGGIKNSI